MVLLVYIVIGILIIAGLAALGRNRPISKEEYESRKGQGGGAGNALLRGAGQGMLELQGILEPGREQLRVAKEEKQDEEDESGDPPDPGDGAGTRRLGHP